MIFSKLPNKDLTSIAGTCKKFNETLMNTESIWQAKCKTGTSSIDSHYFTHKNR